MLSTAFYLAYLPTMVIKAVRHDHNLLEKKLTGAGMIGSVCGVLTYEALPVHISASWIAPLGGIVAAIWISERAERVLQTKDDSRIVIDEWIGAWIAVWGIDPNSWPLMIAGLVLFRIFDVFKGPWGRALQHLPGGFGVCMDDVVAGVIANVLLRGILFSSTIIH